MAKKGHKDDPMYGVGLKIRPPTKKEKAKAKSKKKKKGKKGKGK